jgi:hypothetical protein
MSGEGDFRTPEQEVLKLLEDCADLKRTLQSIAAQVGRMETRVKRAFPQAAEKLRERAKQAKSVSTSSITGEQAQAEFENIVRIASSGSTNEAERLLNEKSASDLFAIAKEVGVAFSKSKPSIKAMREGIFGKVRESILLSRHTPRGS